MSAETGVGPAMASGSHTYNGICADLPAAPTISRMPIRVRTDSGAVGAFWKTVVKSSDPKLFTM
jgi:hypothetical protein